MPGSFPTPRSAKVHEPTSQWRRIPAASSTRFVPACFFFFQSGGGKQVLVVVGASRGRKLESKDTKKTEERNSLLRLENRRWPVQLHLVVVEGAILRSIDIVGAFLEVRGRPGPLDVRRRRGFRRRRLRDRRRRRRAASSSFRRRRRCTRLLRSHLRRRRRCQEEPCAQNERNAPTSHRAERGARCRRAPRAGHVFSPSELKIAIEF